MPTFSLQIVFVLLRVRFTVRYNHTMVRQVCYTYPTVLYLVYVSLCHKKVVYKLNKLNANVSNVFSLHLVRACPSIYL